MKRAGWRFDPEGASRAASKSRRTVAAEISSCLNLRMLLREAIMSDNSTVAPPWKYYEANSTTSCWACQMRFTRKEGLLTPPKTLVAANPSALGERLKVQAATVAKPNSLITRGLPGASETIIHNNVMFIPPNGRIQLASLSPVRNY